MEQQLIDKIVRAMEIEVGDIVIDIINRPTGQIPEGVKDGKVGVVKTPKGYFLLGGGIDSGENHKECIGEIDL